MTELVFSISLHELCQCEEFTEQVIVEVVDHGIAQPVAGHDVADWVFDTTSVHWLRKAVRLHSDLEIDWVAVAMVIDLLRKNEALEKQNRHFEQQLRRFRES
ncbi:MAG: chaperone modulator CbpM [Halioglobus sp.]|nr:chaperone modulator CbpM [Halioglobus sp.]